MLHLVRPHRSGRAKARLRKVGQHLVTPVAQLIYAAAIALFGAWLIAVWVMGLLIILFALCLAVDAMLREGKPEKKPETRHEEILERWKRAR